MNPFLKDGTGAFMRTALAFLLGRIGVGVFTDEETVRYADWILLSGVFIWSVYQKFVNRQKLVTAMAAPTKMTEEVVKETIALGTAPSVTTPVDVVPVATPIKEVPRVS